LASLYEGPVQRLIDELGRLPGIGPKSAQRIAYYLLKIAPEDARRLAGSIIEVKEKISWCRRCFNIAEGELCSYCLDTRRDDTVLCVVEDPRDIAARNASVTSGMPASCITVRISAACRSAMRLRLAAFVNLGL
jgi:recombination protein RecR